MKDLDIMDKLASHLERSRMILDAALQTHQFD